ncbi:MAG: hypothetical protein J6U48_00995 [Alistipes sp.]|nr:hypothetical protein [Alistipes sp.]
MKLVKFFAIAVAAFAVACAPEEQKVNKPVELTESTIYCDVTAAGWENCNAWAWVEGGENYTGGADAQWPGQALEKATNPADGKEYYIWVAPASICGQTIGFIINNGTEQTVDLDLVVADGAIVALTTKGEDGKWLASVNGEETEAPAPKEEPVMVLADHTWGVIGSFNGWGADVEMVVSGNTATATIEILADDADKKFKVRADGAWTDNYGFAATEEMPAAPVDGTQFAATYNGGDIVVAEAGTYEIVLTIEGENEYFNITKK